MKRIELLSDVGVRKVWNKLKMKDRNKTIHAVADALGYSFVGMARRLNRLGLTRSKSGNQ